MSGREIELIKEKSEVEFKKSVNNILNDKTKYHAKVQWETFRVEKVDGGNEYIILIEYKNK